MLRALRYGVWTVVGFVLVVAFAVFVLQMPIPMPWRNKAEAKPPVVQRDLKPIELVEGELHTLAIPEAVRRSLGIQREGKDVVYEVAIPTKNRPLVMAGSTALDPACVMRIRARFAPGEARSIEMVEEPGMFPSMKPIPHELRPGDEVKPGMKLATFYSYEIGNKKNDLFEAIVQLRLDEVILKKAEDAGGSLPDIYLWTARRNVDTDRSGVRRAWNTLLTWGVHPDDIKAVEEEAKKLSITEGRRQELPQAEWADKLEHWARVNLYAPKFVQGSEPAVIVERNLAKDELVVDNTVNLFTIAKVDHLLVLANCPEDLLTDLYKLRDAGQMTWKVYTVGADLREGVEGKIAEIGWIIDQNQHTAVIKGYIPNPGGKIRAGQFANASVELLLPKDVVEVPVNAVVEDGEQSIVFVQTDAAKHHYQMRRVEVVNRFAKSVLVRSKIGANEALTDEEKKLGLLPREPLERGKRVLLSGVSELKAALLNLESQPKSQKEDKR